LQEWYAKAYKVADLQLRKLYEIGHLYEGRGWSIPASVFNYNNTPCKLSEGCYLRDVSMPASGTVDPPPLYDFSFPGDINSTETDPPPGSTPSYNGDDLSCKATEYAGVVPHFITCFILLCRAAPNMEWLQRSDMEYLTPVFFSIAHLYEEEANTSINNFVTFLTVFMPAYMTSFVLIIVFIFMPQVVHTNMDIHTKRTMLLYLPPQVVARIPSIKMMVDEILATDSTHLGTRARAEN
jgi:hypothetical protein